MKALVLSKKKSNVHCKGKKNKFFLGKQKRSELLDSPRYLRSCAGNSSAFFRLARLSALSSFPLPPRPCFFALSISRLSYSSFSFIGPRDKWKLLPFSDCRNYFLCEAFLLFFFFFSKLSNILKSILLRDLEKEWKSFRKGMKQDGRRR